LIFSFDEVEMADIFGVKIDYLEFDVKSMIVKAGGERSFSFYFEFKGSLNLYKGIR